MITTAAKSISAVNIAAIVFLFYLSVVTVDKLAKCFPEDTNSKTRSFSNYSSKWSSISSDSSKILFRCRYSNKIIFIIFWVGTCSTSASSAAIATKFVFATTILAKPFFSTVILFYQGETTWTSRLRWLRRCDVGFSDGIRCIYDI